MANVNATLRNALGQLEAERNRIDRQIAALRMALGESGGSRRGRPPGANRAQKVRRRRRKAMSAAAKKAVSKRMKAYWAKRRAGK
jgi:hypothetical protein